MRTGNSFKKKDITSESISLKAKMQVDPQLRGALIDETDGLLRPGALPAISGASAAGSKQLLDAIDKAGVMGWISQRESKSLGHKNQFPI